MDLFKFDKQRPTYKALVKITDNDAVSRAIARAYTLPNEHKNELAYMFENTMSGEKGA